MNWTQAFTPPRAPSASPERETFISAGSAYPGIASPPRLLAHPACRVTFSNRSETAISCCASGSALIKIAGSTSLIWYGKHALPRWVIATTPPSLPPKEGARRVFECAPRLAPGICGFAVFVWRDPRAIPKHAMLRFSMFMFDFCI
jgi:hypothetical protein